MDSQEPYSHNSPPQPLSTTKEDDDADKYIPIELLRSIADRLGIIELLRFRCVCKDWYTASSSSSAEIQCFLQPWLLLYGRNCGCSVITHTAQEYTLKVAELQGGATCIASEKGWLLIIKNSSIYFSCPFSGAKIELPELPITDHHNYLAAFSSTPTSPDCKVCFFTQESSSARKELYVLVRGETSWTKQALNSKRMNYFKTIRAASFDGDQVYLMDEDDGLIMYDFKKKEAQVYQIVSPSSSSSEQSTVGIMPFITGKNYLSAWKMVRTLPEFQGRFSLAICGTRLVSQQQQRDTVVYGETISTSHENGEEGNSMSVNHKGVWIHPRFFKVSPSFQW